MSAELLEADVRSGVSRVRFGAFSFDAGNGFLYRAGVEIALPPRAVGVLAVLLSRAGQVVSKQALLDEVWKTTNVSDTSLAEAVSLLRQVLGDDPQHPAYIQTVPRRGYRFIAPIELVPAAVGQRPADRERGVALGETPFADSSRAEGPLTSDDGALWTPWLPRLLGFAALVLAVSIGWTLSRPGSRTAQPVVRFTVSLPDGFRVDTRSRSIAIAPDASAVAVAARRGTAPSRLFVRSVGEADAVEVPGSEEATQPFFAPDGRAIAFFSNGRLVRIALPGGTPVVLGEAPSPAGGVWQPDGSIVYAPAFAQGLWRVPGDGSAAAQPITSITPRGDARHAWPQAMNGRGAVLYVAQPLPGREPRLQSVSGGGVREVLMPATFGAGLPDDVLVAVRDQQLVAVTFDDRWELPTGVPVAVPGILVDGTLQLAIAGTGAIAWAPPAPAGGTIEWVAETGATAPLGWNGPPIEPIAVEPDGRLAVRVLRGGARESWTADPARGTLSRAGQAPPPPAGQDVNPSAALAGTAYAFSPDGDLVAWESNAAGEWQILVRDVARRRPELTVARGSHPIWSRDGARLWFLDEAQLMTSVIDRVAWTATPAMPVLSEVARPTGTARDGRVLVTRSPAPAPSGFEVLLGWGQEVRALLRQHEPLPRSFR